MGISWFKEGLDFYFLSLFCASVHSFVGVSCFGFSVKVPAAYEGRRIIVVFCFQ